MTFTPEEIAHIARIARLDLSAEEVAALRRDLDSILLSFYLIEGLPETRIEPQDEEAMPPRFDEPDECPEPVRRGIRRAFPRTEGDHVGVPRGL